MECLNNFIFTQFSCELAEALSKFLCALPSDKWNLAVRSLTLCECPFLDILSLLGLFDIPFYVIDDQLSPPKILVQAPLFSSFWKTLNILATLLPGEQSQCMGCFKLLVEMCQLIDSIEINSKLHCLSLFISERVQNILLLLVFANKSMWRQHFFISP